MSKIITGLFIFALATMLMGSFAEAHGGRYHRYHHFRHHGYYRHHGHHHRARPMRRSDAAPVSESAMVGGGDSSGMASWYRGRGGGLTAAHRYWPFGTRVLVTNRSNGRSVARFEGVALLF